MNLSFAINLKTNSYRHITTPYLADILSHTVIILVGPIDFNCQELNRVLCKNCLRYRIPFIFNNASDVIINKISTHSLPGSKYYMSKNILLVNIHLPV